MRRVILIPYRRQNELRERNRDAVLQWHGDLHIPAYFGDSNPAKPFNRAAARNAAAADAGEWDTALILDADCLTDLAVVGSAFTRAEETDRLILPHDDFWRLTRLGSAKVARNPAFYRRVPEQARRLSDRMTIIEGPNRMPSGALVVTRAAYSAIGGYDERIEGWGYEDNVFLKDAERSVGVERLPGRMMHLWHPRDTGTVDQRTADRTLAAEHRRAYDG